MADVRVIACATFPHDVPSPLHDMAAAFRAGDAAAFAQVLDLVRDAVRAGALGVGHHRELPGGRPVPWVAVPGHRAGAVNGPCEQLIAALAAELPWIAPAPGILARIADAPEGRTAPGRDAAAEAGTLRWAAELVTPDGPVILLDDVVRSGSTITAAIGAAPPGLAARLVPVVVFRAEPSPSGA